MAYSGACGARSSGSRSLLPNIERVDIVLLADEQFSIRHNWMAPGGLVARVDLETPVLPVSSGIGLSQADNPLFAVEIEPVVGKHDGALADAAVAPRYLAGIEFHRHEDGVGKP